MLGLFAFVMKNVQSRVGVLLVVLQTASSLKSVRFFSPTKRRAGVRGGFPCRCSGTVCVEILSEITSAIAVLNGLAEGEYVL